MQDFRGFFYYLFNFSIYCISKGKFYYSSTKSLKSIIVTLVNITYFIIDMQMLNIILQRLHNMLIQLSVKEFSLQILMWQTRLTYLVEAKDNPQQTIVTLNHCRDMFKVLRAIGNGRKRSNRFGFLSSPDTFSSRLTDDVTKMVNAL